MSTVWEKYRQNILSKNLYDNWETEKRYPLPLRIVSERDELEPYVQLIEHVIKRHAANIISGNATDFREQIRKCVETIREDSYNKGLKTANKIIDL